MAELSLAERMKAVTAQEKAAGVHFTQTKKVATTGTAPAGSIARTTPSQSPRAPSFEAQPSAIGSGGFTAGQYGTAKELDIENEADRAAYRELLNRLKVAEGREHKPIAGLSASAKEQLALAKVKITLSQAKWSTQQRIEEGKKPVPAKVATIAALQSGQFYKTREPGETYGQWGKRTAGKFFAIGREVPYEPLMGYEPLRGATEGVIPPATMAPIGPAIPPARQFRMAVEQGLIPEGSRFMGIKEGNILYIPPAQRAQAEMLASAKQTLSPYYMPPVTPYPGVPEVGTRGGYDLTAVFATGTLAQKTAARVLFKDQPGVIAKSLSEVPAYKQAIVAEAKREALLEGKGTGGAPVTGWGTAPSWPYYQAAYMEKGGITPDIATAFKRAEAIPGWERGRSAIASMVAKLPSSFVNFTPYAGLLFKPGYKEEYSALATYGKTYGQGAVYKSGGVEQLTGFFAPARMIYPEVRVQDISKTEWAIGAAQIALYTVPLWGPKVLPKIAKVATKIPGLRGKATPPVTTVQQLRYGKVSEAGLPVEGVSGSKYTPVSTGRISPAIPELGIPEHTGVAYRVIPSGKAVKSPMGFVREGPVTLKGLKGYVEPMPVTVYGEVGAKPIGFELPAMELPSKSVVFTSPEITTAGGIRLPSAYIVGEKIPLEPLWNPYASLTPRVTTMPIIGGGVSVSASTTATMTSAQVAKLTGGLPSVWAVGFIPIQKVALSDIVFPMPVIPTKPFTPIVPVVVPTPIVTPKPAPQPYVKPIPSLEPYVRLTPKPTPSPSPTQVSGPTPVPAPAPAPMPSPFPTPPTAPPITTVTPPPVTLPPITPPWKPPFKWLTFKLPTVSGITTGFQGRRVSFLGKWEMAPEYAGVHPLTGKLTKVGGRRRFKYGNVPSRIVISRITGNNNYSYSGKYYKIKAVA